MDAASDGEPGAGRLSYAVDILFMVDDSTSMSIEQMTLGAGFPGFMSALAALPRGLPDLHIAIVTSNMGAGAFTSSVPGCSAPDLGNFVSTVRASTQPVCTTAFLTGGERFIATGPNVPNNFTGALEDVFRCLVQVGSSGCGFEHQLASVRAALGDRAMNLSAPPGNAGFLRDDALLAIVWLTNEDDCSAPPNSRLFDPSQTNVTDPLGPLASFRCTDFGILCDGQRLPRAAGGPYANCASDDALAVTDPLESLMPVQFYIDYLRRLKSSPSQVVGAAIAAPTQPFSVTLDVSMYPALAHSCAGGGVFGDPAVRLKQVIDSLGDRGSFTSICGQDYSAAMIGLASRIAQALLTAQTQDAGP
jgi:hypothetical protein